MAALLPRKQGFRTVKVKLQGRRRAASRVILPGLLPHGARFSLSFFDDDEPPTRAARPRRPTEPRPRAGTTTGTRARTAASGPPGDPQQLMVRRAIALGAAAIVLIILIVGVKGCLDSRAKNALKDYNRNAGAIVTDSNDQVAKRLFDLLSGAQSTQPLDLQQNVNQVRVNADEDVKRAKALDVPGDMKDAQIALLETLSLRAEGVQKVADQLPNLSGNQAEDAAGKVAGAMSEFLASDVIYAQRVKPFIEQALGDNGIHDQLIVSSRFFPDTQWLDPGFVREELTGKGGGVRPGQQSGPCPCGHGLIAVKVGSTPSTATTLVAGQTNRVPAGSNPSFIVDFQNQGQSDQFDVRVRVSISSAGKPIAVEKRVDQTTAGQQSELTIPIGQTPPIGTPVQVTVTVVKVPGEVNVTNNTQNYTVIFSR
jgi:hypothetical protein